MISDQCGEQWVTLSLEIICTIPFQAGASDVKMSKFSKHSSNRGMPCFVDDMGTIRGIWHQVKENPGALCSCTADIFFYITYREIYGPGKTIA